MMGDEIGVHWAWCYSDIGYGVGKFYVLLLILVSVLQMISKLVPAQVLLALVLSWGQQTICY